MKYDYDILVIGLGPAGMAVSIMGSEMGLKVCAVESHHIGGECMNVGCIPSKALLESSHNYHQCRTAMEVHGIHVGDISFDLKVMMGRKDAVVKQLASGIEYLLKKHKIDRITGTARLLDNRTVQVRGTEELTLKAKAVLLATGSKAESIAGVIIDGEQVISSTEALTFAAVPKHLVVVGAGAIGLELGSVWHRLGAEVTIVEYLDRVLPAADHDISKQCLRLFKRQGLRFLLGSKIEKIERTNDGGCTVTIGGKKPLIADKVLVAAGRSPCTEQLGFTELGGRTDKKGFIEVDDHWQTSVGGIYAIGDIIGGAMLAHKATHEGKVAAEVIAGMKSTFEPMTIPSVAYTDPEVAWMGLNEIEAKEQGIEYEKGAFPWAASGRSLGADRDEGVTKVLFEKGSMRILGAGIVGPNAGELIAEAVLALEMGADAEDISLTIHPHPTLSETFNFAAEMAEGTITDLYIPRKK